MKRRRVPLPGIGRTAWRALTVASALGLMMGSLPAQAAGDGSPQPRAVQFAKGTSSAQLRGTVKGSGDIAYTVTARAGQTLTVSMKPSNASLYFNINPPGSLVSMFVGNMSGQDAQVMLPSDGTYTVLVYLMRNAARRNESATFTLNVGVTGQPLPALTGAQDARIAGTPFHAAAAVACLPTGAEPGGQCKASVIRRGRDGTATVEIQAANGLLRRVLFVKGQPVASDSAEPVKSARQGDLTRVRIGDGEQYDIPDALLTGG